MINTCPENTKKPASGVLSSEPKGKRQVAHTHINSSYTICRGKWHSFRLSPLWQRKGSYDYLKDIHQPTLVVNGGQDAVFTR